MDTVGLLSAVLAIVFSTLTVAHANMADNVGLDQFTEQQEIGSYTSVPVNIISPMVLACKTSHGGLEPSHDSMESSHDGAECCSAMCGSAVLSTAVVLSDKENTHTHIASSESQMKSVDDTGLIRPPSL